MPKRVLAVASVRVDPLTFEHNLMSLRNQVLPKGVTLDLHYIIDDPEPVPLANLVEIYEGTWVLSGERPAGANYGVGPQTHDWNEATFEHLAQNKQRLLDYAVEHGYDYVWVVDTDLILDPLTLWALLSDDVPVVSAVFWTSWQNGAHPMPQVWLAQPYEQNGMGLTLEEFWDKLGRRQLVEVAGGGACTLIKTDVLRHVRYHPRLEGLPQHSMWQGEDRTFSILCQRYHVRQYADGWPDVYHAYHPEMRTTEKLESAYQMLSAPKQTRAKYGDLVNFTLQGLSIEGMHDSALPVRGRLGGLWLAPELEAQLLNTEVGDKRILEITFPLTWPIPQLRGKTGVIQVELVEAKPYSYAPLLADVMFAGVTR